MHYTPDAAANEELYGGEGSNPEAVLGGGVAPPVDMAPLVAAIAEAVAPAIAKAAA